MTSANTAILRFACARCGRKLKPNEWIYSRWTGSRYCVAGKGCNK